jgi:hypothetical protein
MKVLEKSKREIEIQMVYPVQCSLSKEERDEMLGFIQRIIKSYICDDHDVKMSIIDEYGKKTVKF